INFAMFTRHGTAVWLMLYPMGSEQPLGELALHPRRNRTGNHWHILVSGLPETFRYGWRVDGPKGGKNRFDASVVLLDPSATALSDGAVWGQQAQHPERGSKRRSLFFRRPY